MASCSRLLANLLMGMVMHISFGYANETLFCIYRFSDNKNLPGKIKMEGNTSYSAVMLYPTQHLGEYQPHDKYYGLAQNGEILFSDLEIHEPTTKEIESMGNIYVEGYIKLLKASLPNKKVELTENEHWIRVYEHSVNHRNYELKHTVIAIHDAEDSDAFSLNIPKAMIETEEERVYTSTRDLNKIGETVTVTGKKGGRYLFEKDSVKVFLWIEDRQALVPQSLPIKVEAWCAPGKNTSIIDLVYSGSKEDIEYADDKLRYFVLRQNSMMVNELYKCIEFGDQIFMDKIKGDGIQYEPSNGQIVLNVFSGHTRMNMPRALIEKRIITLSTCSEFLYCFKLQGEFNVDENQRYTISHKFGLSEYEALHALNITELPENMYGVDLKYTSTEEPVTMEQMDLHINNAPTVGVLTITDRYEGSLQWTVVTDVKVIGREKQCIEITTVTPSTKMMSIKLENLVYRRGCKFLWRNKINEFEIDVFNYEQNDEGMAVFIIYGEHVASQLYKFGLSSGQSVMRRQSGQQRRSNFRNRPTSARKIFTDSMALIAKPFKQKP